MYARQAIQTKFCGPTNARGSRVKVWCMARSKYFPWDHEKNPCENHHAAAIALALELKWNTEGHGFGALPGGGYALVFPTT
jgi:hypothetical protein